MEPEHGPSGSADHQTSTDFTRLPVPTVNELIGRDAELESLQSYLEDPAVDTVEVFGIGGAGKSALVTEFVDQIASTYASGAFGWSFYSQGSHSIETSSATFFAEALHYFDPGGDLPKRQSERASRLTEHICSRGGLLVLDGIEAVQYPPHENHGWLKDTPLRNFLTRVARNGVDGFVLITSRQPVTELHRFDSHRSIELDPLSTPAAVDLLVHLGVLGTEDTLESAVENLDAHPLALTLLGRLLKSRYGGDAGQHRVVPPLSEVEVEESSHADRVLRHYDDLWDSEAPERAVLFFLGLMDRPIRKKDLRFLWNALNLTDGLPKYGSPRFNEVIDRLKGGNLVSVRRGEYETHPLIRTHFGSKFSRQYPDTYRESQNLLFQRFSSIPEDDQPAHLEELEPLYRAIHHGCRADRTEDALNLYKHRILRESAQYSLYELGAFDSDLAALSNFFTEGWKSSVRSPLDLEDQSWLLSQVSFCFLELGRMRESVAVHEANLEITKQLGDREQVASLYRNLVEAHLALGEFHDALDYARRDVEHVTEDMPLLDRVAALTDLGNALTHLGRMEAAQAKFEEAEARFRDESGSEKDFLYGYAGFQYCQFLIEKARRSLQATKTHLAQNAADRADAALRGAEGEDRPLRVSLYQLVKAQAKRMLGDMSPVGPLLRDAERTMRESGSEEGLSYLLAVAAEEYRLLARTGDASNRRKKARSCTEESISIAEFGEMKTYETDGRLALAALELDVQRPKQAKKHLQQVEPFIVENEYGLREPWLRALQRACRVE